MNDSIKPGDIVLLTDLREYANVIRVDSCSGEDRLIVSLIGSMPGVEFNVGAKGATLVARATSKKRTEIEPGDYVRVPGDSEPYRKVQNCWHISGDLLCHVDMVDHTRAYRAADLVKVDGPNTKKPITIYPGLSWKMDYDTMHGRHFDRIEMSYADAQVLRFQLDLALESARRKETP